MAHKENIVTAVWKVVAQIRTLSDADRGNKPQSTAVTTLEVANSLYYSVFHVHSVRHSKTNTPLAMLPPPPQRTHDLQSDLHTMYSVDTHEYFGQTCCSNLNGYSHKTSGFCYMFAPMYQTTHSYFSDDHKCG
jgi:hypothetical protein